MAKGLNKEYTVNLAFTADTNSAKQQLQDLQNSLTKLVNTSAFKNKNFGLDKDLQNASAAAAQLKVELDSAINTDTGKLDLTKFMDSLKKSNMSIKDYQNQLYQLGPDGEKAFTKLSQAITLAEVPLKRTSSLMSELWTTMKNTARWQLTSSAMHSFIGAVQHAYYYAQDLNESLNNIRIVSGASVEQMDKFAEKANKAAKSLSSTTLDYTNAALIYYQQGLTDQEVADRTEVTLKMANVANESATTISEQLTSVWNNFYDGSESLEHYTDAMVRLGADTASSSSEISEGLQKFSSVAGTIGLSFDNAAAALATITATTRESADVVGTALKTLFSRIQGLNLGETLDDGTDLNKYSTALHKVGIEIKDTDGELKDMDDILDEMGTKWNTWSRETQIALAQTVAGVRQYTQLMTLMNNYDFYKENVERAKNSEGSLQEQADIYAESWDAAKDRVKTSLQAIYKSLINDKFFIEANNKISDILDGINTFIKSLGGMKGILLTIGGIFMSVFQKQIATSLQNMIFNVKNLGIEIANLFRKDKLSNPYDDFKKQVNQQLIEGYQDTNNNGSNDARVTMYKALAKNQLTYLDNVDKMDAKEQAINQQLMDRNRLLAEQAIKEKENLNNLEDQIKQEMKSLAIRTQLKAQSSGKTGDFMKQVEIAGADVIAKGKQQSFVAGLSDYTKQYKNLSKDSEEYTQVITNIKTRMSEFLGLNLDDALEAQLAAIDEAFGKNSQKAREWKDYWKEISNSDTFDLSIFINEMDQFATETNGYFSNSLKVFQSVLQDAGFEGTELSSIMKELTNRLGTELTGAIERSSNAMESATGVTDRHNKSMEKAAQKPITFGQAFISAAGMITNCVQVINTFTNTLDILNDEEASTKDKIIALAAGIGSIIPAIISIASGFKSAAGGVILFGNSVKIAFPVLLAIEVAIAVIIGLLYALNKELKNASPEGQLKKTKKAVEELTTAEQEAKDAADNLRSAIEAYDSAIEKLEECKRGTEEWRDALLEANEAAVDIINTASGLSGEDIRDLYSRNSDGLIEFNREGLKTLQNQADENAQLASYSLAAAQYNNSQAQNNRDAYNLSNQMYDNTLQYDGSGNAYSSNTSKQIQQIILDNLDNLSESMPIEDFKNNLLNLGVDLQNVTDNELTAWQNSIKDMANEADKASAKLELVAGLKADELLGENYTSEEKDFAAKENVAFIKAQTEFYKNVMGHNGIQTYTNQLTGKSKTFEGISAASGTDNKVYQYILKALQDSGRNVYATSDQSKAVQGTDTNRSFEFIENGQAITMTREEIANFLAASDAMEQMGKSANKARKILSGFSEDGVEAVDKVSTIIQDFNSETKKFDLTQVLGELSQSEIDTVKRALEGVSKQSPEEQAQAIAKALGLDGEAFSQLLIELEADGAAFVDAWNAGVEGAEDALDSKTYSDKWRNNDAYTQVDGQGRKSSYIADQFDKLNLKGVSSDGEKKFSQLYEKTYNELGKAGIDNINTLFDTFGDDAGKIADVVNNIDWSSETALEDFNKQLNDAGINAKKVNLEPFTDQMLEIYKISESDGLEKAQSEFKEINDIVKNLDFGDVIDPDKYDKLSEEAKSYFVKMSDGTYKLTTDAKAFYDLVMKQQREKFAQAYQEAKNQAEQYQTQKDNATKVLGDTSIDELGQSAYNSENNSADYDKVNQQLKFLQTMGYNQGQLDTWMADAADRSMMGDTIDQIAGAVRNVKVEYEGLEEKAQEYNESAEEAKNNILGTLTSVDDLDKEIASGGVLTEEDRGTGLEYLALQYSECKDAYDAWVAAKESGDPKLKEQTLQALEQSIRQQEIEKLEIETLGDLATARRKGLIGKDDLAVYDQLAKKTLKGQQAQVAYNEAMKGVAKGTEEANKITKEYKRTIEQIEVDDLATDINSLITKYNALTQAQKDSEDGFDILTSIAEKLQDIFGDSELVNANFVKENWALIQQYLSGTVDEQKAAANELQQLMGTSQVKFYSSVSDSFEAMGIDASTCQSLIEQTEQVLQNANFNKDGSISLDTANAISNLIALSDDATQVAGILNSILNTNIEFDPSDFIKLQQMMQTLADPNADTRAKSYIVNQGIKSIILKAKSNSVAPAVPGALTSPTSSGGGGSSKEKDTKDWDQDKDRYHDYDKAIDKSTRNVNKLSKAVDRLYGASKVSAIQKQIDALKEENKQYEKKLAKAKEYLALDKQALQNNTYGYEVSFNENGFVNLEQTLNKAYEDVKKAQEAYNKALTDDAKKVYEEAQQKFENFKKLIEQYEETLELIQELEDQIEDNQDEIMAKNYEKLTVEVEYKIQIDENELKKLDYFFNKLSDNIYKAAEAFGYLQGQIDPTFGKMSSYEDFYNKLESSYANGEITQADYVDGLQDAYDSILDNLQAVQDLDKEMLEYYGNTLDLAEEELSKYTDQMEHLTSVLDHYRSILSLLGRDTDYAKVLTVLEGNAQTKRNNFDASKAWYESLKAERDAAAAALTQASDDAERELLQKNYDAIVAKFNEAEEQMLSDAEAYGEAIKEVLTTKMEQAAENMNKAMTDGMGWDALNDSLDRLSKYQDEYLTKTNQIYEMNKLLNDINKASNKTNNQAAKDKYYQFSKEIEQLKEKDKLSQLELDIAQAKYKVLQAQIALDEAQNAMGKVRLQRDNEGNFGYVYTADQDKIDDAQQALADAENDLYNIRLDATNKYGQQKLQYEQELAEKLKEIDEKANEDALYREGNYQADRQRIIDEYTQLIQASSDLYRIAQEEDSRVVQDAWINAYDEIIDSGDQWKTAIIDYTDQINSAFQEWQSETDRLTDLVGKDLVDTKNKVDDVTNASDQLKDEVVNKVVPALTQELQAVRNTTEAYARQRQEIMTLISYYEQLINKIQQAIAAQASMDAGSNSSSTDYDDYDPNVDYSALMGTVPIGSELYNKYKAYRDRKMSEGNYSGMASTARVNAFYEKGYVLGQGLFAGYSNFTQIPDWLWQQTVGFKTGGYTGSWGDSGKLAMLHEKELVLNKEDTQNMLSSIKMVREIASEIDLRSRYTTMPINPIYSTLGTGNDVLEQQVHIDASFPNVTDRNEIQEAFNTLINVASQYANRK